MPAATAATVFSVTPVLGIDVGAKASTPAVKIKTKVTASDGYVYIYAKASETIGSIETIKIGASGSASSDAGSAGWTANVPGGAATGQHFWARRTSLA